MVFYGVLLYTGVPVRDSEKWYDCCETPYSLVVFTVHLRRKPLTYIVNLILPCCLFSVITLISFTLQPGCTDRLALGWYSRTTASAAPDDAEFISRLIFWRI